MGKIFFVTVVISWLLLSPYCAAICDSDPWYFEPNRIRDAYDKLPNSPLLEEIKIIVIDKDKIKFFSTLENKNYIDEIADGFAEHATNVASVIAGDEEYLDCENCENKCNKIKIKGILSKPSVSVDPKFLSKSAHYANNITDIIESIGKECEAEKNKQKKLKKVVTENAQNCEIINISLSIKHHSPHRQKIFQDEILKDYVFKFKILRWLALNVLGILIDINHCLQDLHYDSSTSLYESLKSFNLSKEFGNKFNAELKMKWFEELLKIRDVQDKDDYLDAVKKWESYLINQIVPYAGIQSEEVKNKADKFLLEMQKCEKELKALYDEYSKTVPVADKILEKSVLLWKETLDNTLNVCPNIIISISAGNDDKEIKAAGGLKDPGDKNKNIPRASHLLILPHTNTSVIRVGALQKYSSTEEPKKADFSNYGRDYVDIMAPGKDIPVLTLNNKAKLTSGTSFSSPIVAGTAALLLLCKPHADAAEITSAVLNNADTYEHLNDYVKDGRVLNILNSVKEFCIDDIMTGEEEEEDEDYYSNYEGKDYDEL